MHESLGVQRLPSRLHQYRTSSRTTGHSGDLDYNTGLCLLRFYPKTLEQK